MPNETTRQLQKHLERLETRQEQTKKQIEHFRGVIAFFMSMEDSEELNLSSGDLLKNQIEYTLQVKGVPLHPKEIHQILQEQAVHVQGEDPVHNTRSHMSGDKQERFYPAGDGTWGLTKWKTQDGRSEQDQHDRPEQPCLPMDHQNQAGMSPEPDNAAPESPQDSRQTDVADVAKVADAASEAENNKDQDPADPSQQPELHQVGVTLPTNLPQNWQTEPDPTAA